MIHLCYDILREFAERREKMIQAIEITELEHDQFVKDHPLGDMCQLISWAKVKAQFGWQWDRVSVGDGQKITGVSTLLYKKIPLINKTICYAPRGFILDWNDSETLDSLLEAVKVNAKKHDAILIKVDPNINREEDHYLTLFQKLGFKHQGFSLGFKDGIQPRFVMVTDISLEEKKLLKSFVSRARTYVRKSGRFGLIFEDAPLEKMSIFSRLMDETGERDGFLTRNMSYFEEIYKQMNPQNEAKLFLVKMVADETIDSL